METIRVTEGSTAVVTFAIEDEAGDPVAADDLETATLTLYDLDTMDPGASPATGIINDRSAQDVLNDHNVTISSDGAVVWTMQPEDNVIVTARRQRERHRALFQFAWDGGHVSQEIEIVVENFRGLAA